MRSFTDFHTQQKLRRKQGVEERREQFKAMDKDYDDKLQKIQSMHL